MGERPWRQVLAEAGGSPKELAPLYVWGAAAALSGPVLVCLIGLLVHVLAGAAGRAPRGWLLGPWVAGRWASWPWLGRTDWCLAALLGLLLLVGAVHLGAWLAAGRAARRAGGRAAMRLREALYRHARLRAGEDWLEDARAVRERVFGQRVEQIREAVAAWRRETACSAPAAILFAAAALAAHFWLGLLVILLCALAGRLRWLGRRRAWERLSQWRRQAASWRTLALERLEAIARGAAAPSDDAFRRELAVWERAARREADHRGLLAAAAVAMVGLTAAFVLLVVGLSPEMTLSEAAAAAAAVAGGALPALRLLRWPALREAAEQAAADVWDRLEQPPLVTEPVGARPAGPLRQRLELRAVRLTAPRGGELLRDLSLELASGRRIAWVACDPRPLQALAGLIARYFAPQEGDVLWDGADMRQLKIDSVRRQVGLILSRGALTTATVAENIRWGGRWTDQQVVEAARRAGALGIIQRLPDQWRTVIGPRGASLAPAEVVHICLARELLRNPSVLIVEEPAEELRGDEALALDTAIETAAAGRTLVLLAARLQTLRAADCVQLIHQGRLVGQAPHAELLQQSELYRHINYMRFNAYRNLACSP